MNSTIFARLVPVALVILPAAASAQSRSVTIAQNNVAASTSVPAPTTTTAATPEASAQPAEKKICKMLPSSYSRMNVRSCLTAKQWKQVEASQQDQ